MFGCVNRRDVIGVDQRLQHTGGYKGGDGRTKVDILKPKVQKRKQNADRLLFIPRKHQCQRQIIHTAVKCLGESQRNLNGAVGIVALPAVENSRNPLNLTQVEVVDPVFSAGKRQNDGIRWRKLCKIRVVASAGRSAVATTDQEKVADLALFDKPYDLVSV